MATKTKTSWTKPAFCPECFANKVPKHTIMMKEYLIGGYWVTCGVPSMRVMCAGCETWIPNNVIKDYLGRYNYGK